MEEDEIPLSKHVDHIDFIKLPHQKEEIEASIYYAKRIQRAIIPSDEFTEKIFKLNNWYSQSPWLLISVKKSKSFD